MRKFCIGLEASHLIKSQLLSLDFSVNRFFMKLFWTGSIEIVKRCQEYFDIEIPAQPPRRINQFENIFIFKTVTIMSCKYFL